MPARKTIAKRAPATKKTAVVRKPLVERAPPVAITRPSEPEPPPASRKPAKQRAKLIRDGFTMPEGDFALIAALKARSLTAHREAKKSELLRAGLHALMALDGPALVTALGRLQPLKVGRPKKG